jgi:hypothetical protein
MTTTINLLIKRTSEHLLEPHTIRYEHSPTPSHVHTLGQYKHGLVWPWRPDTLEPRGLLVSYCRIVNAMYLLCSSSVYFYI